MKKNYKFLLVLGSMFLACSAISAQGEAKIIPFKMKDGSRILKVSDNGKWAVGNSIKESEAKDPNLYDVDKETVAPLLSQEEIERGFPAAASDVSDDGVVVGSYNQRPAYYKDGKWTTLPTPEVDLPEATLALANGMVTGISADGKTMVGYVLYGWSHCYACWWIDGVLQEMNLPKDVLGNESKMTTLSAVSGDGKIITGAVSYNELPGRVVFVYENGQAHYVAEDFINEEVSGIKHCNFLEDQTISPDGKYMAGMCFYNWPGQYEGYVNGGLAPNFCDLENNEFTKLDTGEMAFGALDNTGIFYAFSPVNFPFGRVAQIYTNFGDREFLDFSSVLNKYYGLDFEEETGFESTGTILGASADGTVIAACATLGGYNYIVKLPYGIRVALEGGPETGIQSEKTAGAPKVTVNGGELTIAGDNAASMTITDLSGATVKSANVLSSTVNVSDLNQGLYIVTLNTVDGNKYTSKICIK